MHKVGTQAHTPHGIGEITEAETVRGRTTYRVAGRGFNVYIEASKLQVASGSVFDGGNPSHSDLGHHPGQNFPHPSRFEDEGEQDHYPGHNFPHPGGYPHEAGLESTVDPGHPYHVNKDNSTTLPYDPTPQHPVDIFRGEQTIKPGEFETDADDRLHASDSLTGEQRKDNRPYPGPNPDLFAKSARFDDEDPDYGGPGPEHDPHYEQHSKDLAHEREQDWKHLGAAENTAPEWGDDEWHEGLPTPEYSASYRPAGISDRYAFILESDDHSEAGQFRRDPLDYMQRQAHVMIAGEEDHLFQKFADYDNLLDVDPHMREAAWKDVAAKAKRLRAEGAVHPEDIGPNRIMATVDGDNGTYKTLVLRGPSYAGIGKGANSATFSCSCMWGKWAFKRQYTFVGRMCSHSLATLWELQSHMSKGNKGKFKSAAVTDEFKKWADDNNDGHIDQGTIQDFLNTKGEDFTREDVDKLYGYVDSHHQEAPERDYDIDYTLDNDKAYKTADVLRTQPQSLTPDLRLVPQNDEHEWTDVTEDDRKTTGPDQIVHFSAIMASLHTADTGQIGLAQDPAANGSGTPPPSDTGRPDHPGLTQFRHWMDPGANPPGEGQANDGYVPRDDKGMPTGQSPAPAQGAGHNFYKDPDWYGNGASPQAGSGSAPNFYKDWYGNGANPQPPVAAPGAAVPGAKPVQGPPGPNGAPASAAGATQHVPAVQGPPGPTGAPPPAPIGGPGAPGNPAPPAAPNAIGQGTSYKVQQGDTLSDIAQRAGLGKDQYQQIADQNQGLIKDPNHIETGWDLKIPGQSSGGTPGQGESVAPDASTPPVSPSGSPAPPKPIDDSALAAGLGQKPNTPGTPPAPTPAAGLPPGGPIAPPQPGGPSVGVQPSPNSAPIDNKPFNPNHASRRYAESSDAGLLDKLRQLSHEPASDSLQHMDSRNDELRDVVEELQDRGVDASFMVASLHFADSPADGNPDFLGQSSPGWADQPAAGSGPDPRHYISDSQSYLDSHEPDLHDVTDLGDDDGITKFNDSRSRPQQGPRHASEGVKRAGGGPQRGIRVDPGARQGGAPKNPLRHAQGTMPENEDMTALPPPDAPDPMASSGNDLVANFQRSAAAQDLWSDNSSSGGMYSDDAIAANAQAMMRTAGRKFTQAEQRALEEESHIMGARNLPTEAELSGTHYVMGI